MVIQFNIYLFLISIFYLEYTYLRQKCDVKRESEPTPIQQFSTQMSKTVRAELDYNQKPSTHSRYSVWVAGTQLCEPSPAASQNTR